MAEKKLTKKQLAALRQLAVDLANAALAEDDDTVLVCNPVTEPAFFPIEDQRFDTCKWCNVDIYYDKMMPSPIGLVRVCVPCGRLLLEAQKKGAN